MPGYQDFLGRTFETTNHVPSTRLGHFDARLAARAATFTVTVKMQFDYTDMYYSLAHGGDQKPSSHHGRDLLRRFFDAAAEAVPRVWDNAFEFYVDKPDWPEYRVRPRFVLQRVDPGTAHYQVQVSDESADWNNQAVVTEGPRGEGTAHYATFTSDVVTTRATGQKLEFVVADLVEGYDLPLSSLVPTVKRSNQLLSSLLQPAEPDGTIFGAREYAEWEREARALEVRAVAEERRGETRAVARLREFLQIFRSIRGAADIRQFQLLVKTRGPINRHGSLLELVQTELDRHERSILKSSFEFTPLGSSDRSLTIALRAAGVSSPEARAHVDRIQAILLQQHARGVQYAGFAQNTITHEFGHMLGLPDEYICLLKQTRDKLRDLDFFPVLPEFSAERWCRFQSPATAQVREVEAIAQNQSQFVDLCVRAGLEPLVFGRKTLSLMSAGPELRLHHGVTLWECLCQLTREFLEPGDWKMRLVHR